MACGLHFHLSQWPGWRQMQSIATTTDDLENREIGAAEIHGVYAIWAYGGGTRGGA